MSEKTLVRNLLQIPRMDIWNIPDVPYVVVYEDGVEVELIEIDSTHYGNKK